MATTPKFPPLNHPVIGPNGLITPVWALYLQGLNGQAAAAGTGTVTGVTGTSPIVSSGGTAPAISHANSGVTAATYGDSTHVAQVTVNATGHVTGVSNVAISGGSGITELTGDVTAGPGSGSQVAGLAASGVSAATYGDSTHVAQVTVDAKGRITSAANVAISGGGSGALVLLEQHTASASASLDFTAWYSSTYDEYMIEVFGFVPATNSAAPRLQFSTNGGASYDTANNYSWAHLNMTFGVSAGSNTQTSVPGILLFADSAGNGLSNTGAPALVCSLRLYDPGGSNQKAVSGHGFAVYGPSGGKYHFTLSGTYNITTAVDAFRVVMSGGNIASGTIRVYGLAK